MKKIIILLLLIPFCVAQPPFQASSTSLVPSITIAYPKIEYHQTNEPLRMNFHPFNSTYQKLDNITTDCTIHIYGPRGTHLVEEQLLYDTGEFYIQINATVFSIAQQADFIIWCNSTQEAGLVSGTFYITESGFGPVQETTQTQGIDLLMVVMVVLALLAIASRDMGMVVMSGISLFLSGLTVLQLQYLIPPFTEKIQYGFGLVLALIGFYILLWAAFKLIFRPKEPEEVIIEQD